MDISNLSINQIKSKKKDDLLAGILALKENGIHSAKNSVVEILKSLPQEIYDPKTEITSLKQENTNLRNTVESNENNSKKIKELETANGDLTQYVKRNNKEISGMPDICKDDALEGKVIEIFNLNDIKVTNSDIEVCHCLNIKNVTSKRATARFTNRKICTMNSRKEKERG